MIFLNFCTARKQIKISIRIDETQNNFIEGEELICETKHFLLLKDNEWETIKNKIINERKNDKQKIIRVKLKKRKIQKIKRREKKKKKEKQNDYIIYII